MPDVMAIVSKKIFENQAGCLTVGDVWETREYVSSNRGVAPLEDGGTLFLVTVRPGNVLWLVATLDNPTFAGDRWTSAMNTTPITDLTEHIGDIAFANGKTLVRGPKLGMSLQTPRTASSDTAAMLRGSPGTPVSDPPAAATVAEERTWDDVNHVWEIGERDVQGRRQGTWRFWRADGTLVGECPYVDDEPDGVNHRYHPDGSAASDGQWRAGVMYDCSYYRPATGTTDEPWSPDTPDNVVRVTYLSADGLANDTIRYFDQHANERDHAGRETPDLPSGLPDTARYFSDMDFSAPDGSMGGWVDGRIERGTDSKLGTWRWWSTTGELLRTERYNERGQPQALFNADEPNPIDTCIAEFLRNPHEFSPRHELSEIWDMDIHATMTDRLVDQPTECTAAYLGLLNDDLDEYRRIWTAKLHFPSLVIELVTDWAKRHGKDKDMDAWTMYANGLRAATALQDRKRVATWLEKLRAIAVPPKKQRSSHFPFLLFDALSKTGDLAKSIDKLLSRATADQHKAAKVLLKKGAAVELSDEQLILLAAEQIGCPATPLLRDPNTGEAWLLDPFEHHTYYFDGKTFGDSDITIDVRSKNDVRFVAAAHTCDERVLLWSGKFGWNLMQRYGRRVFWHAAKYYVSRGQAEVTDIAWFTAPDIEGARRIMRMIRGRLPKSARSIDPWMDPKLGVVVRSYDTDALSTLGVYGDAWITGRHSPRIVERFKDHRAAVAAFERMELEHMRKGVVLERLSVTGPLDL